MTVTSPPPPSVTPPPSRSGRPWTVRVADWSAAHRWPVFGLWFVATIGLFVVSILAGGTKAVEAVSNNDRSRSESGEAYVIWSTANPATTVQEPASQQFLMLVSSAGRTIDDPGLAADVAAMTKRLSDLQATVDGVTGPVIVQLVDPIGAPQAAGLISPDRTTVQLVGRVPGDGVALVKRLASVPAEIDAIRAAYPADQIHILNNTLLNREISEAINGGLDRLLLPIAIVTFLILLVAFGAVVASVVPLLLAVTALLAAFGILGLYSQYVASVSPYASQLVVLIGLAVAVDYSLFMITRFRSERRHGRDRLAAIDVASSTAGRAVFFSGLAVMISIGGLFLLDDPLFRSMAVGTIAVIFVSMLGSLTFLPAILALLGDRLNLLRLPILGRDREEGSGLWARLVRAVMRRPLVLATVVVVALLVTASPIVRLHMGQADLSAFPDRLDSVQAINILNDKWPSGSTMELDVVVTNADAAPAKTAIDSMSTAILAIQGMGGPAKTVMSRDGHVAFVSYLMGGTQNDVRNQDIVRQIRSSIVPASFGGLPGVRALVTGDAAYTLDVVSFYTRGIPMVVAFVLTLSFVLLLVAFRSIVIPIKAIVLNLLSTGAAFGIMVFVFQDGNLSGLLGFKPGPIESFIPVFVFTILFGLSMDYHVFILTRIKEARDHGMSSNEAVARGIAITSGTITSAAAIMVAVFSAFVTLETTLIKQIGLGLAVAVLIDATIVRSVLLPATMRLLGEWNWWLPSWLGWLPHVTIEGEVDEDETGAIPALT